MKLKTKTLIQDILFSIVNVVILFVTIFYASSNIFVESKMNYFIIIVSFIIISATTAVIIHELGHLIMGLISGYKFSSFRVFSKHLQKTKNNQYKVYIKSIPGTLGQCLMAPPQTKDLPIFLYNFGGVLFNLLSSILVFLIMLITKNYYLSIFSIVFTTISTVLATSNWINIKNVSNDGNNYRSAKNNQTAKKALFYILDIEHHLALGNKLSDYDISEIESFEIINDPLIINALMYLYTYYLVTNDLENYQNLLNEIEAQLDDKNPLINNLIKTDYYLLQLILNNPEYLKCKSIEVDRIIKQLKASESIKVLHILEQYRSKQLNQQTYDKLKTNLKDTYRSGLAEEYINLLDQIIMFN